MPPEAESTGEDTPVCCPLYHEAVELIGRRWTGAIVEVLLQQPGMRFGTSRTPCRSSRTGCSPSA